MRLDVLIFSLFLSSTSLFAGELEEAIAAYQSRDFEQALELFQPLADKGNPEAQRKLGVMYRHGLGVQPDDKRAIFWYRRAAEGGHQQAQNSLGVMYRFGLGVQQDLRESIHWLTIAAKSGHAKAQENLGMLFFSEEQEGGVPNYKDAALWLSMAATQGQRKAQATIGLMYLAGRGVSKNEEKGMEYIRQAATNGHPQSIEAMIKAHEEGVFGVQKSEKMAETWREYRKSLGGGR